jgi:hypothetical protein
VQEDKQSLLEWLVSNMASWFNQRITAGESNWARGFERTEIDGLPAYKPLTPGNGWLMPAVASTDRFNGCRMTTAPTTHPR